MESVNKNDLIFCITKDDLEFEAQEKLGRRLSYEEIQIAKKGLEYGLLTGIDIVYRTIFTEMI